MGKHRQRIEEEPDDMLDERDIDTSVHPGVPQVAAAAYLRQWANLAALRPTATIPAISLAVPRKHHKPTWLQKKKVGGYLNAGPVGKGEGDR